MWWVIAQIPHTVLVRDVDGQTDARREKIQKEFKRHIWRNCAGEASRMSKVLLFSWFGFHRNVCVLWFTHILLNTFSSVREGRSLSFLNLFFTRDRNITRAILDVNYLDCITTQLQWPDLNANRLTLSLRFYPLHVLFPPYNPPIFTEGKHHCYCTYVTQSFWASILDYQITSKSSSFSVHRTLSLLLLKTCAFIWA